jgi:hypothetical protein
MVSCPTATAVPVPVRGTINPGPCTKILPASVAADCGAKAMVKVTLCPAARDSGRAGPVIENIAPVVCRAVRDTAHLRVLVSTRGRVEVDPTVFEPKETLDGVAVTNGLLTPVPLTVSVRVGLEALLTKATVPVVQPGVVGAKATLTLALWPAARTVGNDPTEALNSALLRFISDRVTLVEPLLVRFTIKVSPVPTPTFAKRRAVDELVSCWALCAACMGRTPSRLMIANLVRRLIRRTGTSCDMGGGSLIAVSILNVLRRKR